MGEMPIYCPLTIRQAALLCLPDDSPLLDQNQDPTDLPTLVQAAIAHCTHPSNTFLQLVDSLPSWRSTPAFHACIPCHSFWILLLTAKSATNNLDLMHLLLSKWRPSKPTLAYLVIQIESLWDLHVASGTPRTKYLDCVYELVHENQSTVVPPILLSHLAKFIRSFEHDPSDWTSTIHTYLQLVQIYTRLIILQPKLDLSDPDFIQFISCVIRASVNIYHCKGALSFWDPSCTPDPQFMLLKAALNLVMITGSAPAHVPVFDYALRTLVTLIPTPLKPNAPVWALLGKLTAVLVAHSASCDVQALVTCFSHLFYTDAVSPVYGSQTLHCCHFDAAVHVLRLLSVLDCRPFISQCSEPLLRTFIQRITECICLPVVSSVPADPAHVVICAFRLNSRVPENPKPTLPQKSLALLARWIDIWQVSGPLIQHGLELFLCACPPLVSEGNVVGYAIHMSKIVRSLAQSPLVHVKLKQDMQLIAHWRRILVLLSNYSLDAVGGQNSRLRLQLALSIQVLVSDPDLMDKVVDPPFIQHAIKCLIKHISSTKEPTNDSNYIKFPLPLIVESLSHSTPILDVLCQDACALLTALVECFTTHYMHYHYFLALIKLWILRSTDPTTLVRNILYPIQANYFHMPSEWNAFWLVHVTAMYHTHVPPSQKSGRWLAQVITRFHNKKRQQAYPPVKAFDPETIVGCALIASQFAPAKMKVDCAWNPGTPHANHVGGPIALKITTNDDPSTCEMQHECGECLAEHSEYFRGLICGSFQESRQSVLEIGFVESSALVTEFLAVCRTTSEAQLVGWFWEMVDRVGAYAALQLVVSLVGLSDRIMSTELETRCMYLVHAIVDPGSALMRCGGAAQAKERVHEVGVQLVYACECGTEEGWEMPIVMNATRQLMKCVSGLDMAEDLLLSLVNHVVERA